MLRSGSICGKRNKVNISVLRHEERKKMCSFLVTEENEVWIGQREFL